MSFTQSFESCYYIVDTSHTFLVKDVGIIYPKDKLQVTLIPMHQSYKSEPAYCFSAKQDFEKIYDMYIKLQKLSLKEYIYTVNYSMKTMTLGGFEIVKATPSVTCTIEDNAHELYKALIAEKLSKKRCRLNSLVRKLDISKLSDGRLDQLEEIVKNIS